MVGTPFILFYIIGMIFQSSLDYLLKLVAFVAIYLAIYSANHFVFDERLFDVLPMSIYLATKVICFSLFFFLSLLPLNFEYLNYKKKMPINSLDSIDVDLYHMGILVGSSCRVVFVANARRWVRTSLDMLFTIVAWWSWKNYSHTRR